MRSIVASSTYLGSLDAVTQIEAVLCRNAPGSQGKCTQLSITVAGVFADQNAGVNGALNEGYASARNKQPFSSIDHQEAYFIKTSTLVNRDYKLTK